jgi:hypothetical protein
VKPVDFRKTRAWALSVARRWIEHLKLRWKVTRKRLHRFAGLISFCGVVVVLATFIVKDVLRDEEKDLLAALQTAQRTFDFRVATDSILEGQSELADRIDKDTKSEITPAYVFRPLYSYLTVCSSLLQRLKILGKSLPEKEAKQVGESAKHFQQELDKIAATTRTPMLVVPMQQLQEMQEKSKLPFLFPLDLEASQADTIRKEQELQGLILLRLRDKMYHLEDRLIQEVAVEARKAARRLKRFTYLSYFLYSAGVFIGVLGQLAGVKSAGGE